MSVVTICVVAVLTLASRLSGTVLLPAPRGSLALVLDRFPAPLFACLAAAALIDDAGALVPIPVLAATGAAVISTSTRSLPLIGLAGVAGYAIGAAMS
jgi:hypothetical protein